jgi:hypothetical protein
MSGYGLESNLSGLNGGENTDGAARKSAGIRNTLLWSLTCSRYASVRGQIPHTGVSHTFAVACLELEEMARGNGKPKDGEKPSGMPRFIDVPLSADDKHAFKEFLPAASDLVGWMARMCDSGYRIGSSWSGESQSYTVSLTCRDPESPNAGMCMTSFAKDLRTAVALAQFKHEVLTRGVWVSAAERDMGEFG